MLNDKLSIGLIPWKLRSILLISSLSHIFCKKRKVHCEKAVYLLNILFSLKLLRQYDYCIACNTNAKYYSTFSLVYPKLYWVTSSLSCPVTRLIQCSSAFITENYSYEIRFHAFLHPTYTFYFVAVWLLLMSFASVPYILRLFLLVYIHNTSFLFLFFQIFFY